MVYVADRLEHLAPAARIAKDPPKGRIAVSWRLEDGQLKVEKRLPPGGVDISGRGAASKAPAATADE